MTSKIVIIALSVLMGIAASCAPATPMAPPVFPATVAPQPAAPISVSFVANPGTISAGQCTNLVWDVAGTADSIKLD